MAVLPRRRPGRRRCYSAHGRMALIGLVCWVVSSACAKKHEPELASRPALSAVDLEFRRAGSFGAFLDKLPGFTRVGGEQLRLVRPLPGSAARSSYRRIAIRPGPSRKIAGAAVKLRATLGAVIQGDQATFSFDCEGLVRPWLRGWFFGTWRAKRVATLDIEVGGSSYPVRFTREPHRLFRYDLPLPQSFCQDKRRDRLKLVARPADSGLALTWPVLVSRTAEAYPPVILISLDGLRADSWDGRSSRPPSLQQFHDDSLRYRRCYTSSPGTSESHSTLLSGLRPGAIGQHASGEVLSLVSNLRDAGYTTLGFVGGGLMRARFGFRSGHPGFAQGFDLYLEGLQVLAARRRSRTRQIGDPLRAEAKLHTHTLGPTLERSLRWFRKYPSEPVFQLLHAYDVQEYRSVARAYWDRTLEKGLGLGAERADIERCAKRVGLTRGERMIVHFPFSKGSGEDRVELAQEDRTCHRKLTGLLYEARVRSSEDTLARYFDALRQLGAYDRALILLTSDHGESLLDERGSDGRLHWGHARPTIKNLHVPLWIKLPGRTKQGKDIDDVVGLVDVRATIGGALGVKLDGRDGIDLLGQRHERARPLSFAALRGGRGAILPNGDVCSWTGPLTKRKTARSTGKPSGSEAGTRQANASRPSGAAFRYYHAGRWGPGDATARSRCEAALARIDHEPAVTR